MAALTTPEAISHFQLLTLRAAVKMEGLGMRHSSGRSATAHAKRLLGMKMSAKREEVLAELNKRLEVRHA